MATNHFSHHQTPTWKCQHYAACRYRTPRRFILKCIKIFNYVVCHLMECTMASNFVTAQSWKLDDSSVQWAQIPHSTVNIHSSIDEIDGIPDGTWNCSTLDRALASTVSACTHNRIHDVRIALAVWPTFKFISHCIDVKPFLYGYSAIDVPHILPLSVSQRLFYTFQAVSLLQSCQLSVSLFSTLSQ